MVHDTHLYDLLSVLATAPLEEIARSYKRLALRLHPDKTNHDPVLTEKFKDATRAYEILKDASLRQIYDVYGEEGLETIPASAQAGATAFTGSFACPEALAFFSHFFNDMSNAFKGQHPFEGMPQFGFPGPSTEPGTKKVLPAPQDPNANAMRRGADIHHTFNVTLADMYYGKAVKFQLPKATKCSRCDGAGCFNPQTCSVCRGSGRVIITVAQPFLQFQELCSCKPCRGTGVFYNKRDKCPDCDDGYLTVNKIIKVNVLPGSKDGDKFILKGQSDEGKNIIPGDVVIHLKEVHHETLIRRFNDLYLEQTIDLRTALLGGSILVHDFVRKGQDLKILINVHGQSELNKEEHPSIDVGEVVGTINQGTVKIIKGLGMPINKHIKQGVYMQESNDKHNDVGLYKRGDLFIRFSVEIPTLDELVQLDSLLLLSKVLPRSASVNSSGDTKTYHVSNLQTEASPIMKSAVLSSQASEEHHDIELDEAAASESEDYDYDHLDIDGSDDVEQEDAHFYETEWTKEADVSKKRKQNKGSPIPVKIKKPDLDNRHGVLT